MWYIYTMEFYSAIKNNSGEYHVKWSKPGSKIKDHLCSPNMEARNKLNVHINTYMIRERGWTRLY
jgi:hypothetical protein